MNKIVKRHYPIDRLPADLRSGLREHGWVHIEIEPEKGTPLRTKLSLLVASGKNVHGDEKAVLALINFGRWSCLEKAPVDSRRFPSRSMWGAIRNWLGF